jgi:PAS domain S-box-containing protein
LEDVVIVDPGGMILAVDAGRAGWLPRVPASCLGNCLYAYFQASASAVLRQTVADVLASGTSRRCRLASLEDRVLDVRLVPLADAAGVVTSLTVCLGDATREDRLERQFHKLAAAIEQAVEAVIITDEQFAIEYVNQAFEAMTGVSQGQARGRGLKTFYKGRRQAEKFERGAAALMRGDVWTGRFLLVDAAGDTRVCDQTISPVRARHGVVVGYAFVWRDATEVSRLEKQLRHAQKMEILGTLAGGIAHDFRNILGPIVLHTELCLERVAPDDPLAASLLEILDAVRRAKALGEQLLSLGGRVESDAPVRFRLSVLVKECVRFLRSSLSPGIAIRLQANAVHDEMQADPAQVHQVIMNLFTNAVEAMSGEEGGLLTLRIEEAVVDEAGWPQEPTLPPGEYLRLTINDTGRGMTSEVLERIFEPFFSTKHAGQGTGLGLSMVRHIVSRMRGAVTVESHPGLGTAFHVLLPKGPPVCQTAAPIPPPALPARRAARILFVDENPVMARCAAMALVRLGYAVESCVSLGEALTVLSEGSERFDLVMVDLSRPHHGGFDLVRQLMRLRPGLSVILLSAHSGMVSEEMLRETGIKAFLAKPFCFEELDKVIREVLAAAT